MKIAHWSIPWFSFLGMFANRPTGGVHSTSWKDDPADLLPIISFAPSMISLVWRHFIKKNVVFLETPAVTISRFRRKKNMMKIPRIFCFYFMIPMAAILSELRSGSLRHASSHSQRELVLRPCSAAGDVTELSSVMVMMVDNSDLIPINHHQPTIIYQVVSWWFMVDHGRLMVVSWWFSRDSTDLESLSARLRVQDLVGAQVWAKIGKTMKHMGYPLVI